MRSSTGFRTKPNGDQLAAIAGLVVKGTVKVNVETVLPLPESMVLSFPVLRSLRLLLVRQEKLGGSNELKSVHHVKWSKDM